MRLAPYIKFGCVSIREVYWSLAKSQLDALDREALMVGLVWREFYTHVCYHWPSYYMGYSERPRKWVESQMLLDVKDEGVS